jgi:hypothetical protein
MITFCMMFYWLLDPAPNEPVHIALTRARTRTLSSLVERTTAEIDALTCQPTGNAADGNAHPPKDLADHLKVQLKQVIAHVLEENATFETLTEQSFNPNVHINLAKQKQTSGCNNSTTTTNILLSTSTI